MFGKLTAKVLIIIGATLSFSFTIMGVLSLYLVYNSTLNLQKKNARQLANTVNHDILSQMTKGDMKDFEKYVGDIKAKGEIVDIRLFNTEAREWGKGAVSELMKRSLASATALEVAEKIDGRRLLTLALPMANDERCHGCHDSKNRFNGGLLLTTSLDEGVASAFRMMAMISAVGIVFFIGILTVLFFFFKKTIVAPIQALCRHVGAIGEGDLTHTIQTSRSDEIGVLTADLDRMGNRLREIITEIAGGAGTLSASVTHLTTISREMTTCVDQSVLRAQGIASAAEEMSANMSSVASAMGETTSNVNTVATATEEMTATIAGVAANSDKARTITSQAVVHTRKVTEQVTSLGRAANEIGKVTEVITAISAQTNLLALNATIEAARAGAAGKGFTVVATEIKQLAQQTAAATEGIREKIENIQASTTETVKDIAKIMEIMHEVDQVIMCTATAIDEQSLVTHDIASNIMQAAHGAQEVNQNVAQTSDVAATIAMDIGEANAINGTLSRKNTLILNNANELAGLAEQLEQLTARFKI